MGCILDTYLDNIQYFEMALHLETHKPVFFRIKAISPCMF